MPDDLAINIDPLEPATRSGGRDQDRALLQAVEQLSDFLIIFGLDGRVRYTNDAYLRWCGRPSKTVIGTPVWRLPGAPERRQELHWVRKKLSAGDSWRREYDVRRSDHEVRILSVNVSPVRGADRDVVEMIAIASDVTAYRRLESIAAASNLHDHLGVVFAGIRHELGNPINSVKAALRVVTDNFDTMPQPKLYNYLTQMADEIGRVEYLLRTLRSYSLYDRLQPESIDLPVFMARFAQLAKRDFRRNGHVIALTVESSADRVWADPQALHQVLLNLLGNAAVALEGRTAGRVSIHAARRDDLCVVTVHDNGHGIPAHELPHVFKPFYTTHAGGTGLGLPICRHLLALMRATIDISSSPDGTEVCVVLDCAQPSSDSRPHRG